MWEVEYTYEFEDWWDSLTIGEQESVEAVVELLIQHGVNLDHPASTKVYGTSRHHRLRELRIQHKGYPYRVLYMFDPRRTAILLLGGNKTGDKRWYSRFVPIAERLYDEYLDELRSEGLING